MKKKILLLASLALLASSQAYARTWVLTSTRSNTEVGNWKISSADLHFSGTEFNIEQKVLHGGTQEGSKVIILTSTNGLRIEISPTRGMALLRAEGYGVRLGWDSPVEEVVNPAFMNLESRSGFGWLEGFNEMLTRSGYEWSGHPATENGQFYTLLGKAGNTPASQVEVEIDDKAPHEIRIRGLLKEMAFKKADLQTMTELRYVPGSNRFSLHDVLTNHAATAHDYQILYQNNFGTPVLEEGARFIAPVDTISPYDADSAAGLRTWQTYAGPVLNSEQQTFNLVPMANADQETLAALVNRAGNKGVAIHFNLNQLPVLTLWKNTDAEKQGYVTGIEPGTSYRYPLTIERAQKRIKQLAPDKSTAFDLTYTLLHNASQVAAVEKEAAQIQGNKAVKIVDTPLAK